MQSLPTTQDIAAKAFTITRTGYDTLTGYLNQTMAKVLLRSPAKYKHALANPPKATAALREGIMTHAAVLQPDLFARYKPEPDVKKNTKEGKAAYEYWKTTLADTDLPCDCDEYDNALSYADAVKQAMARYNIVPVATEVMLKADYMVPIKGSLDLIAEDGYIYDIKTTAEEATPKGFGRQLIWSDDFKLQAAWYLLLCKLNFGVRPKGFRFLVVEKEAPFLTAVFELHPDLIAEGETLMMSAIKAYEVCKSFNEWPAYPTEVITIARPQSTAAIAPINFA